MPKIRLCKEKECHNSRTTEGYCRLHYLRHWKQLRLEKRKKAADKLNRYVENLMKRNPKQYVEEIKKDLRSKDFEDRIESQFGPEEPPENLFEVPTSDEDLEGILDGIKIEKEF